MFSLTRQAARMSARCAAAGLAPTVDALVFAACILTETMSSAVQAVITPRLMTERLLFLQITLAGARITEGAAQSEGVADAALGLQRIADDGARTFHVAPKRTASRNEKRPG
ncbi:MAG: hypothetical protein H7335_14390 [Massilia sp.]|nr:hypothetical protein [Massilia sp.]